MRNKKSSIIILIGLILIFSGIAYLCKNYYEDYRAGKRSEAVIEQLYIPTNTASELPKEMPKTVIDNYTYIGVIKIPALNLTLPVIDEWSEVKLETAPCRYMGNIYDNNMIIMGHSYKWHFRYLYNLVEGDLVEYCDLGGNTFQYKVTEVLILQPEQGDVLLGGDWDLTVFSCKNQGEQRVVVRCKKAV